MSEESVETVRGFVEAFYDRKDFESAFGFADPDLEMDWSESKAPYAGVVRGYEAVREMFEQVAEAFIDWEVERRDFTGCSPNRVVVEQSIAGRGRSSRALVRATGATLWEVRDGKVVSGKLFQSKAEALEAARLSR